MTVESEGLELNIETMGEGPDAVILHGWGGSTAAVRPIASMISDRYRVTMIDLPGCGLSEKPPHAFSAEDYARVVILALESVGVSRPVLIGHSNGGRTIIAMCGRMGYEAEKIVLVDSAGLKSKQTLVGRMKTAAYKFGRGFLSLSVFGGRFDEIIESWRERRGSADYRAASGVMRETLVRLVNEDLSDALPMVKFPTLLIWGEKDTATPVWQGEKMERLIPDAGLVVLAGAGHYSYLDSPGRFRLIVRSFLECDK